MNDSLFVPLIYGVLGSTLIGMHFGSIAVGISVYCCIAAAGGWQ